MNRLQQVLVGALVVQIALAGLVFWPRSNAAGSSGAPLFANLKPEDVVSLTVSDNKGSSIKLSKQGDAWVLPDADNFPADATKITPLLTKLAGLKSSRLVTKTAASQAQLQVADNAFNTRLDIATSGGTSYVLYVGSTASGGDTHVRVGGQSEVYLTSDISSYDVRPDATVWTDATYLSVTSTDVTALTLKNASGQLAFQKDAQGKWTLQGLAAGEQFNQSAFDALLSLAGSVRFTKPLGKTAQPAYGLAQPAATVTLQAKKDNQDKTYTLTIGPADKDNTYAAKSSESEYYVRLNEFSAKDFTTKQRADFIVQPTPAPAAAGTPQGPTLPKP